MRNLPFLIVNCASQLFIMKNFLLFLALLTVNFAKAQVGIGTVTPDASAQLDVNSSNKGFLPPQVALTATNSAGPISNPATGLLVYNTATAGSSPTNVLPGYYYNAGTTGSPNWVRLAIISSDPKTYSIASVTSNFNITSSNLSDIYAVNTTSGSISINLPESPVDGQVIRILDATGNAQTNPITVQGNSHNINGVGTYFLTNAYQSVVFVYSASFSSWLILAQSNTLILA